MQLCVALDLPTMEENLNLVAKLKDYDIWLKVGFRAFIRDGKPLIEAIKAVNPRFKIFLDLKLYDIPNTMADAAQSIAQLNIDMFNVHASAGKKAMHAVMQRLSTVPNRPIVLAVTALTSFSEADFQMVYNQDIASKADRFALDSYQSGMDGVVCSVHESASIKRVTHPSFMTLTPGIRPFGEAAGDQTRVATVEDAKAQSVDFIVVGRPIYESATPQEVVEKIISKL